MTTYIEKNLQVWQQAQARPLRTLGISLHLLLRTLFGIFWLAAAYNKISKDWLSTDILKEIYLERLTELPPDAFAVLYLQHFAIPMYKLIAWVISFGELYVGIGLLLGLTTRWAAGVSLFILVNLAIGGYYDASLLPFFILNFLFLCKPSGLWMGLDRTLARKFPNAPWF
jgi:thiosulfate dehydrogenase [quinone] large subunit